MRFRTASSSPFGFASRVRCCGALWGISSINAATVVLPTAPSGFSAVPAAPSGFTTAPSAAPADGGAARTFLEGFTLATTMSGTYDSNVTQSPGGSVAPVQDDFIMSLGGSIGYMSKSSDWTFGGTYRGSYNQYFSQSDFSGYNQGGSAVVNYSGGRFNASLTTGIDYDEGSNRNYNSAFVARTSVNTNFTAGYRLSPKTSLQGNLGQSYSTASGGDFSDTESFNAGISALWKYSPLTEWGPGLRYTYNTGSSQTGRSSVGPTLTVNYKLSTKVALNSRVGVDFASYEEGGSADPTFSTSIGLNYQASKLWGMNLSLYRDTQADPSVAGSFTEVTSLRVGYHRKVRRATFNMGVGYDVNSLQSPDGGAGDDRNYFTTDASLGMPVFLNSSFASIFARYSDQQSGVTDSWDGVQMGFSISRSF
jgi:hypothetical protein